jgi:hypothetical protein
MLNLRQVCNTTCDIPLRKEIAAGLKKMAREIEE